MTLRNRIFIGVFAAFLLLVMLGAPTKWILTEQGVLASDNVGNIITVDYVYEGDSLYARFFNGIEEGKRLVRDIYTNYIPFYVDITAAASTARTTLNRPVTSFLMNRGNEILRASLAEETREPAGSETPPESLPVDIVTTESLSPDTVPVAEETVTTAEPMETEPLYEPECEAVYLRGDARHRYYEIKAKESEDAPLINFLVRIPAEDSDSLRPTMKAQAEKINDFQRRRPAVNWYVFPVTCFEDTVLCDMVLPAESKRTLFEDFFKQLDAEVQADSLQIATFAEKDRMYFKTDHHWNVYGYTEGYRLMAEMFRENYPDIEVLQPEIYTYNNIINMFGSNATATANYSIKNDWFHVADFHLPKHDLTIADGVPYGGTEDRETRYKRYAEGKYKTERGYNHYIEFFRIAEKIVYPENNTGRNLLLICDSYSPPLQEVLASHFDTTIVRYVDSNSDLPSGAYEDFIDENNITDVLLFEMSDRVIYDYYGDSLAGLR